MFCYYIYIFFTLVMKWKMTSKSNTKTFFYKQGKFPAEWMLWHVVLSYKHINLTNAQPCRLLLMHKHSGNIVTADIPQVTHAIKRQNSTADLARNDLP